RAFPTRRSSDLARKRAERIGGTQIHQLNAVLVGIDERNLRWAFEFRIRVYFVIGQDNRGLLGPCLVAHASVLIGSSHLLEFTIFVNDHSVLAAKGQGFIGSR